MVSDIFNFNITILFCQKNPVFQRLSSVLYNISKVVCYKMLELYIAISGNIKAATWRNCNFVPFCSRVKTEWLNCKKLQVSCKRWLTCEKSKISRKRWFTCKKLQVEWLTLKFICQIFLRIIPLRFFFNHFLFYNFNSHFSGTVKSILSQMVNCTSLVSRLINV